MSIILGKTPFNLGSIKSIWIYEYNRWWTIVFVASLLDHSPLHTNRKYPFTCKTNQHLRCQNKDNCTSLVIWVFIKGITIIVVQYLFNTIWVVNFISELYSNFFETEFCSIIIDSVQLLQQSSGVNPKQGSEITKCFVEIIRS